MLSIRTNMSAFIAHRNLGLHQKVIAKSLQRLSSGYRINSAADDAAGLAISERMRSQIRGLTMASRNAQDAVSALQTAEGGLNESHAILHRMKELTVQAANGTYGDEDRQLLNVEYQALLDELDRIANSTHYNGKKLLDGSSGAERGSGRLSDLGIAASPVLTGAYTGTGKLTISKTAGGGALLSFQTGDETHTYDLADGAPEDVAFTLKDGSVITFAGLDASVLRQGSISNLHLQGAGGIDTTGMIVADSSTALTFQVGANGGADQRIGLHLGDMSSASLGLIAQGHSLRDTDILSVDNANHANAVVEAAVKQVSYERAKIGATINRLGHTINNLGTSIENLTDAESRIRDADMAQEIMNYTKANILSQAAQLMLAQAMQQPNIILQMLRAL